MKKSVGILAVILAALIRVQADDKTVKTPTESPLSSKPNQVTTSSLKDTTPANLRENPAYNIPFPEPTAGFKDNPNPKAVKIGPMPDALLPMGPPTTFIKMPSPAQASANHPPTVDLPARSVVEIPQATEKAPSAGVSQEVVTVSPFLEWIQNTKNAVEIAKQQRQAVEQNDLKDQGPKDGTDQDLFLHIRFPYVGNQDLPPGGGSVTYSIPQR